jgi:hypothetical protein
MSRVAVDEQIADATVWRRCGKQLEIEADCPRACNNLLGSPTGFRS